ncbi:hypothetical protein AGMMS49928_01730 [Spirochaetia bacterium]|nr:hypothetical protein AGMMS49928_01730 [Spirochaetia bacterium]
MATISEEPEKGEKNERNANDNFSEALNNFIQRNRRTIVLTAALILVILGGAIAGLAIADGLRTRALAQAEDLNRRYETLSQDIKTPEKQSDVETLLKDLTDFGDKHSGYAGARAYSIAAEIHAEKENWSAAEASWRAAARAAGKIYLAPVSLFNAAAAAEEQGNTADAIELYTQCLTYSDIFPAAPRAQFAIGRLREEAGDKAAAVEAYNEVLNRWPDYTVWTNLAQSRIIALDLPKP